MSAALCTARYSRSETGVNLLTLDNGLLRILIVPDKGADIYGLIDLKSGVDLLWKSPQGLSPLRSNTGLSSEAAWLEYYEGGWQEIFPNGGDACTLLGVELNFHGESTLLPWTITSISETPDAVTVEALVRLRRSPLEVRRRMTLRAGSAALFIEEEMYNWSAISYPLMWGHHPALGAPLLSGAARLHTNARSILVEQHYDPEFNPLLPGSRSAWPNALTKEGRQLDLSHLPAEQDQRDMLAYLLDFAGDPWFAVTNSALGLGIGFAWEEPFTCCWLWQEVHATQGFPWYGSAYTVACEPWTSYPGFGLQRVMDSTHTHLMLGARQRLSTALTMCCFPIEDERGVVTLTRDGRMLYQ